MPAHKPQGGHQGHNMSHAHAHNSHPQHKSHPQQHHSHPQQHHSHPQQHHSHPQQHHSHPQHNGQYPVTAPPVYPVMSSTDHHNGGYNHNQDSGDECCGDCFGDGGKSDDQTCCYGTEEEYNFCFCMCDCAFRLFCFSFFGVCIRLPFHPRNHKAPGSEQADMCDLVSVCCN